MIVPQIHFGRSGKSIGPWVTEHFRVLRKYFPKKEKNRENLDKRKNLEENESIEKMIPVL